MVHTIFRCPTCATDVFYETGDKDAIDHIISLGDAVEGEIWVTTDEGSRFPAAYRDFAEGRSHRWTSKRRFETKDDFIANHNGDMIELWKDEDEVGHPLLATKEMDGLGEVEAIFLENTPLQREADEEEEQEDDDDDVAYDPFD